MQLSSSGHTEPPPEMDESYPEHQMTRQLQVLRLLAIQTPLRLLPIPMIQHSTLWPKSQHIPRRISHGHRFPRPEGSFANTYQVWPQSLMVMYRHHLQPPIGPGQREMGLDILRNHPRTFLPIIRVVSVVISEEEDFAKFRQLHRFISHHIHSKAQRQRRNIPSTPTHSPDNTTSPTL